MNDFVRLTASLDNVRKSGLDIRRVDAMSDAEATSTIPLLDGDAANAVAHRGGHIQIIAAAGSGKTEVVSQRVAALIGEGVDPASIVAFTFTEKAAAELKERIRERVTARVGEGAIDKLGNLFVGTIHAYCFRLLQTHVPRYETYTPLDQNQLVNLLYREGGFKRLHLKRFDDKSRLFAGVHAFLKSVDVVENELLDSDDLPMDDFRVTLEKYYAMLDNYRFMSFGTQIVRAVEALADPTVHAAVTEALTHLIVDEYQDVNPAQEKLIRLLAKPRGNADLVVVGDDDQAIYQWRGSNVRNIVTFSERYEAVATFNLLTNRRSRQPIVELANSFAQTIPERLDKEMSAYREAAGTSISFAVGFDDEQTEADELALSIERLHDDGIPYRDIAILVRARSAYPRILDALAISGIPVQPGGRTGLFDQPEAETFGATYAWISGVDWSTQRWGGGDQILLTELMKRYTGTFNLDQGAADNLQGHLIAWKQAANESRPNPDLVGDFYSLVALLGVAEWDLADDKQRNRLGTIARFTTVLADYETVTRRSRRDNENPGEQVGGQGGGEWFQRNLAILLKNYATGSYDDFDGEEDLTGDAVALGTVHGAKGLEWPVVFLPSLTKNRFPSNKVGTPQVWLVPRDKFEADRYEGSDADERRLFYVALTRARDWISLSSHDRVNKNQVPISPYLKHCADYTQGGGFPIPPESLSAHQLPDLTVTYSELASYTNCPRSYLLRSRLGFMPPIQAELGYGNGHLGAHQGHRQAAEAQADQ
jgi:DNA helicase II / ATP-dependent DNA helicase PcrA